jgi:hypothetical protein
MTTTITAHGGVEFNYSIFLHAVMRKHALARLHISGTGTIFFSSEGLKLKIGLDPVQVQALPGATFAF